MFETIFASRAITRVIAKLLVGGMPPNPLEHEASFVAVVDS